MVADGIQFEPEQSAIEFEPEQTAVDFAPEASAIDFQPASPPRDERRATLKVEPEKGLLVRLKDTVRESLSPLIGPTEDQILRDSMIDPVSGEVLYKPLGSKVEQRGFFPAIYEAATTPKQFIPRFQPDPEDSTAEAIGKGAMNVASGMVEFMTTTPAGVASIPLGAAFPRATAGVFSADVARHTPEAARVAGEASVTGTTQEKAEAYLGLGAQVALAGHLGKTAATKPKAAVVADLAKSDAPLTAKVVQEKVIEPIEFEPESVQIEFPFPSEAPVATVAPPSKIRRPAEWGAEDYLKQAGLGDLAGRLREWEDFGMKTEAELTSGIDAIRQGTRSGDFKQAEAEVGEYLRLRERGAKSKEQSDIYRAEAEQYRENLGPAANQIIDWMKETGKRTGEIAQELDIHVQSETGSRPMKNLGESHYPRLLSERTYEVLSNPHSPKNATEYGQLLRDMVENGNAKSIDAADAMLRKEWNEKVGGDFFGNAELARGLKLPDKYYETSLTGYLSFLRQFSKRASEIKAFGQKLRDTTDAFENAQKTTRDTDMQGYISRLRDAVYQEKPNDPWLKAFDTIRKTAGLAYLSGPFTAVRDLVSAIGQTAVTFESAHTLKAATQGLVDSAMAIAKTAKRVGTGDLTAVKPSIVKQAQELGALKRDLYAGALMDVHPEGGWQTAYKYGLWAKGATERLGRSINAAAALSWLNKNAPAIRANPSSSSSLKAQYTLKRLGFEGERLQSLINGDPATVGQFVRYAVREKQYGYTPSQAPLVMDHNYIKFFTQFQKWGAQALRDFDRNVAKPALQGDVINGKQVRDYMPLVRFALVSVGAGELLYAMRGQLTGKDRQDASAEEISNTLSEDQSRALSLAFQRIASDVVMSGGTGLIGDYAMNVREFVTRGKSKNPMEPPGMNMMKQIAGLATARIQRGQTLDGLGRDIEDMLLKFPIVSQTEVPALEAMRSIGLETEAVKIKEAKAEVTWLRSLARRFSDEKGYDEKRAMGPSEYAKGPNSEVFDSLNEALLTGNTGEARRIIDEWVAGGGKLLSLQASARARQPLRVGGVENEEVRQEFMQWAEKRVPSQVGRINKIAETYSDTAIAVGLK